MSRLGPIEVEQLARELRVVLDVGLRAPRIHGVLPRLACLKALVSVPEHEGDDWAIAVSIVDLATRAVDALGDGPYGQAVSDLFGTRSATRGLPKARRRMAAAEDLDTEVATFIRHWERDILLDVAVQLLG